MELVEVSLPFENPYLLELPKMAGDGAVGSFGLYHAIFGKQNGGHHAQTAIALGDAVALHVAIIVFARPHIAPFGFHHVSHHVVNQSMFVVNLIFFK